MVTKRKGFKRFLCAMLGMVMLLSTFSAGFSVIASAEDWVQITGYKYTPVTLYVKQDGLTSGKTYLIGIGSNSTIVTNSITAQSITRKSKGTTSYYTKSDGSNVKYVADNYYIVDETNKAYSQQEWLWQSNKLYNSYTQKYLTRDSSNNLVMKSSTSYTWTATTLDSNPKLKTNSRYFRYNNGEYELSTSTGYTTVYPYQKMTVYKRVVDSNKTGYYIYNGQTDFNIAVGSTFNESIVKKAVSVIYKDSETSDTYKYYTMSDSRISLQWNDMVDTSVMGDYTATVYVYDTPIADVTVTVGEEGPILVDVTSDSSTSDLMSQFSGTTADDGKVLTDKTVQDKSDEFGAFATYAEDEFSVTLSALGQAYPIIETEETYEIEKMHPDVVFVIDASASMVEDNVAGSTTVSRAEATAMALNSAIKSLYAADPETRIGIVTYNDNWNEMGIYLPLDVYTLPEGQEDYVLWDGRNLAKSSSTGAVSGTYQVRTTSSSKTATATTLSAIPVSSANGITRPADSDLTFLATSNGVSYYVGYYNEIIYVFRDGYDKRITQFKSTGDDNLNTFYEDENIKITRTGSGTNKGVSYITYSYANSTGNFNIQFESVENLISTNFLINSSGTVVRPSSYQFHYSCGTYTQAGLKAAENMFYDYTDADLAHRIPTIVLISDGIPTIGDQNTTSPHLQITQGETTGYGYSDGNNVTSEQLSLLGLYTIKTGISVKERVNTLYHQYWEEGTAYESMFYSIGPGVSYIFGKTVLDPCQENMNLAMQETVGVGGECGNAVGIDLYNAITDEFGSGVDDYVDYVDWSYTGNMSGTELNEAFTEIVESIIYVSRPVEALGDSSNDFIKSQAAMIFTDTIGDGMSVSEEPVLRYNNTNYRPTSSTIKEENGTKTISYTYSYKVKETSTGKIYSLANQAIEVITDSTGRQTVMWYISADLIPLINYDKETESYSFMDAIRLIFKVGITDYTKVQTYYSNSVEEPTDVQYLPVIGNPYYYDNTEGSDGRMHSTLKTNLGGVTDKTSNETETLSYSSAVSVDEYGYISTLHGNNGTETMRSTSITVTKIWDDNHDMYDIRPDSITLQVYKNSEIYGDTIVISGDDVEVSTDENGNDVWTYTIPDLIYEENVVYTVEELAVPDNYTQTYSKDTLTITNKLIRMEINPDVIVVDYGKTIMCSPLENDSGALSLEGIGEIGENDYSDSYTSQNGVFDVEDDNVTFSPFSYMSSINRVKYYAKVLTPVGGTDVLSSTIYVIPATTVYYEDDFGGSTENGGLYISYTGDWYTVTDDGDEVSGITANTDITDRQDRGEVGEGNTPYGYDSSYDNDINFSNGTAAKVIGTVSRVNGKNQFNAYAEFDFTGTGFDIISRTDMDCGMITISVYDDAGNFVDNVPVINKGTNVLYQIPVISYTGLEYSTYHIKINVNAPAKLLNITGSNFYLDAIRIYDPMGTSNTENSEFNEANAAYNTDNEANAYIASIRDYIIKADALDTTETYGAVYVDTIDNEYSGGGMLQKDIIKDFTITGPNEEVYLSPGYGVGFIVESTKLPSSVQLGIKVPAPIKDGASLSAQTYQKNNITNFVVSSAAEMFYDITPAVEFTKSTDSDNNTVYRATVILSNGLPTTDMGEIVSITNLKLTYPDEVVVIDENDITTQSVSTAIVSTFSDESEDISGNENLAVCALKANWDTYVNVFDTVYVQHQASCPEEIISSAVSNKTVKTRENTDITVKTSRYVNSLSVFDDEGNPVSLTSVSSTVDDNLILTENYTQAKIWKLSFLALGKNGEKKYTVVTDDDSDSLDFNVEINTPSVTGIAVKTMPTKTVYKYGERFNLDGMVLTVQYSDGSAKDISSGFTADDTKLTKSGENAVTVSYLDKSVDVNVTVKKPNFLQNLFNSFIKFFKR